ncbi:hypothetical protein BFJ72_g14036 [Fusarium proliferatum]|uniref:Uncharacterized protein n=1 Tax=Gibberella intermedia TaxID=948311 RepID=A0A420S7R5_GIBIN|nr:hypothetical protein BFJ72_g14036 [Fusarium proliferatum]
MDDGDFDLDRIWGVGPEFGGKSGSESESDCAPQSPTIPESESSYDETAQHISAGGIFDDRGPHVTSRDNFASYEEPRDAPASGHNSRIHETNVSRESKPLDPLLRGARCCASIVIVEDRYGQDLIQQMSQLSINTEYNNETASPEAQDQQRFYQEQERQANERELARKRGERFQLEQQRQKQEQLHREQRKRDYQREQERLAKQREDNRKQQQQSPSFDLGNGVPVPQWALGVNPEDSLSSKQWKPMSSRFFLEEEYNQSERYLAKRKGIAYTVPQTVITETNLAKEERNVVQYSHQKWVEDVTALAWNIRLYKADCKFDTSSLRDQLRRKLEQGPRWSTFGIMMGKLWL